MLFTSQTAAVCTVSGATLQIIAVGTCTVAANQPGNANFLAAPQVLRSFLVRQTQTLTFAPLAPRSLADGGFTPAATATSGLPVVYASNSTAVCSVAGNLLTRVAPGTCSSTASQPGNGLWAAATTATQTFAVTATTNPADGGVPLPLWALGLLGAGTASGLARRRHATDTRA